MKSDDRKVIQKVTSNIIPLRSTISYAGGAGEGGSTAVAEGGAAAGEAPALSESSDLHFFFPPMGTILIPASTWVLMVAMTARQTMVIMVVKRILRVEWVRRSLVFSKGTVME